MTNKKILQNRGLTTADAVRLVLNILDGYDKSSSISPIEFCHKVIEVGKRHIRTKEIKFSEGLFLYIESKQHLRPDSFKDIKYLSARLLKANPDFANRNFSEFSVSDCENWLNQTFSTPSQFKRSANERYVSNDPKGETAYEVSASQFNKGRAMLHALFEYAVRREWCDRNPIKLVERKKVIEKEIKPLTLAQTQQIIKTSQAPKFKDCLPAVALLTYAGIRPREVRRLKWSDIDLSENSITIRSQCSKTGGVRQVEICPVLRNYLKKYKSEPDSYLCGKNWRRRWKNIRDSAGFKAKWTQDVLRHTYASHYAKHFHDLPRLQINMGHRDLSLLQSRYVNMSDISRFDAKTFFMG